MKNKTYAIMGRIVFFGGLILVGSTLSRTDSARFSELVYCSFFEILKTFDLVVFYAFSVITTVFGFIMMCVHSGGAKQKHQPYAKDTQ